MFHDRLLQTSTGAIRSLPAHLQMLGDTSDISPKTLRRHSAPLHFPRRSTPFNAGTDSRSIPVVIDFLELTGAMVLVLVILATPATLKQGTTFFLRIWRAQKPFDLPLLLCLLLQYWTHQAMSWLHSSPGQGRISVLPTMTGKQPLNTKLGECAHKILVSLLPVGVTLEIEN